jgi:hypothetical protein
VVSLPDLGRDRLGAWWHALPERERFYCELRVGRQHAMEANQMETRARHQGRQALHELQRLHDDMGGAVFVRTLQLQYDLAGAVTLEPFVGDGPAG